jgi:sugar-specific transcriptional regulator TrmB/DNA-binding CsgD family transcriptional regulator
MDRRVAPPPEPAVYPSDREVRRDLGDTRPPVGEDRILRRFGISAETERIWRVLVADPSASIKHIADCCEISQPQIRAGFSELADARLLRRDPSPSGFAAIDPAVAVETKILAEERQLAQSRLELSDLRAIIPELSSEFERGRAESGPLRGFDLVVGLDEIRRQVYLAGERAMHELRSLCQTVPVEARRHARETDRASFRHGVRQREIVGLDDLRDPAIFAELSLLHSLGGELRTLREIPSRLLVFDDDLAVLPIEPNSWPRRAMFIRERSLVSVLIYIFEHLWKDASPVFVDSSQTEKRSERHARVLELLAVGTKDEAIARTLGVGVRTIRRDVFDLKTALGVSSRTEVVGAAVRKGWL